MYRTSAETVADPGFTVEQEPSDRNRTDNFSPVVCKKCIK